MSPEILRMAERAVKYFMWRCRSESPEFSFLFFTFLFVGYCAEFDFQVNPHLDQFA